VALVAVGSATPAAAPSTAVESLKAGPPPPPDATSSPPPTTNPAAGCIVAGIAGHLVRVVSLVTAALNPAQIILGGGLGTDHRLLAIVQEAQQSPETTPPRFRPTIRAAALGPLAGAIGAANLAQEGTRRNPMTHGTLRYRGPLDW
jgi:hypothetical protein